MSKTTYYYVIDAEGFYPKQAFDDATSFDSEQEAKDIARSYGGRVLALDFVTALLEQLEDVAKQPLRWAAMKCQKQQSAISEDGILRPKA